MNRLFAHRTAALALSALVGALALAGCGSDDQAGSSPRPSSTAQVSGEHNDADVAFVNGMTPHHAGAVDMSDLAASRAGSAAVKALASRIKAAQRPEIDLMRDMAAAWGVPAPSLTEEPSHTGHGQEMSSADMVEALKDLEGPAFDRRFLELMIDHHEGALAMARAELTAGSNPQAKRMAQAVVTSQTAEIAEMKRLLAAL